MSPKDKNQTKYGYVKVVNFTMKSRSQDNKIKINSINNEGKSVFAERSIITVKNKICNI